MLSKQARTNLIAGLTTADNTEIIEQLLTEIGELTTCLESCGTFADTDDTSTFTANAPAEDGFRQKFEDLQKKYVERFMNGGSDTTADTDGDGDTNGDTDGDGDTEPETIEKLFESEED